MWITGRTRFGWLDDQDGIPKSINKGLCHLYKEDPVLKEVREDSFRISKGRPIKGNGNTGEVHWMGRKHVAGVPTGEKVGAIIVFVEDESHAHCFNVDSLFKVRFWTSMTPS